MLRITLAVLFSVFSSTGFCEPANSTPPSGESLYNKACIVCHSPKVAKAMGAPAAHDTKAWSIRIKNAKKTAAKNPDFYADKYEYLSYQVRIGKGLMHHGGLCLEMRDVNEECSNEAYTAAIKYMSQ